MLSRSVAMPVTRADWADERLRAEILTGRLRPGDRIPVERLAEAWGVSATPIRESLRRLAGDGLVDLTPQRGARVATVDADLAHEIYAVRLLLEPVALRQSLEAAVDDKNFVRDVSAAFDDMVEADSYVERLDRHRTFHMTLVSRCPNRTLLDEIASLTDRSRLFQILSAPADPDSGHGRDHRRLRDSAIAGDVETTIAIHTNHLASTLDALI
ncbi:MAG: GntR family transcriptional regulator [Ilumatobacteraceae bacterium]